MRISTVLRLIHVLGILRRYQVDKTMALALPKRYGLALCRWINPALWARPQNGLSRGAMLRLALESLGPLFVKFGQVMSTRQDLLPEDIAEELALLQDKVAPFPGEQAEKLVAQSLDQPLNALFKHFDSQCLASASVAQVHAATLHSGESVVVKVIRPGIAKQIAKDLTLLRSMANMMLYWINDGQRFRPHAVIDEFARHLSLELDLVHEGANASQLARNFKGSTLLHVPKVYWSHTRKNVLVMERVYGVKISDISAMQDKGVDFKVLAENGVTIFFTQLLRDNFFHADMHPGNIFVDCTNPARPRYIAVDFGIMGSLTKDDQRYIAENLLAFFEQDYQRVAEMHIRSRWIPPETPVNDFAGSIRAVCEPIFEKPFSEISYAQLLGRLLGIAEQYTMPIQPQLLLLQKTLLNIEGLGRVLYPGLDLWTTAKPILQQWMKEQRSPKRFFKQMVKQSPYWRDQLLAMPDLLQQVLAQQSSPVAPKPQDLTRGHCRLWLFICGLIVGVGVMVYWPLWTSWLVFHDRCGAALLSVGVVIFVLGYGFSKKRSRLCGIT